MYINSNIQSLHTCLPLKQRKCGLCKDAKKPIKTDTNRRPSVKLPISSRASILFDKTNNELMNIDDALITRPSSVLEHNSKPIGSEQKFENYRFDCNTNWAAQICPMDSNVDAKSATSRSKEKSKKIDVYMPRMYTEYNTDAYGTKPSNLSMREKSCQENTQLARTTSDYEFDANRSETNKNAFLFLKSNNLKKFK
jgi:hypothetical protein